MGKYKATSKDRLAGGLLLGAVASSLAVAALSGAGTASAGCVSISGQTFTSGGGGVCSTDPEPGNIAVGNGGDLYAHAGMGPGNIAISVGTGAEVAANGAGNFALANGNRGNNNGFTVFTPGGGQYVVPANPAFGTFADAIGVSNRALTIGDASTTYAQGTNNVATSVGLGSNSVAIGSGKIANAIGNNKNSYNMP